MFTLAFAARRIGTIEPVEQARQALGRNRRTLVLHAQASVAETDTYLAAIGGEAQGVVQQVGQHPPQHAAVAGQAQAAFAQQADVAVFRQRLVELQQRVDFRAQVQGLAAGRQQAVVGLGQQQHVVDHRGEPFQLLEVAVQGLAIILQRAWAGQYHLGLGQQTGERGAQLVGDVGGERREALEGFFQARQHGVQLAGQPAQLLWHPAGVEAGGEGVGGNPRGDFAHPSQRRQAGAGGPGAEQRRGQRRQAHGQPDQLAHALQEVLVMTDVEDHCELRRSVVAGLQRGAEFAVGGQAGMRRLRQALEPEAAIRAVQAQAEVGMACQFAQQFRFAAAHLLFRAEAAQLIAKHRELGGHRHMVELDEMLVDGPAEDQSGDQRDRRRAGGEQQA